MSLTHAIPATPDHVKRQIDKMDKIHAEATLNMPLCPGPDEFGQVRMPYQDLRALLKNRSELATVAGFWQGWVLAKRDPS